MSDVQHCCHGVPHDKDQDDGGLDMSQHPQHVSLYMCLCDPSPSRDDATRRVGCQLDAPDMSL